MVSSPLDRCLQTAAAVAEGREVEVHADDRLAEVHYGDWTGRQLKDLAKEPLWAVVQQHPSAAGVPRPGGGGAGRHPGPGRRRGPGVGREGHRAGRRPDAVWLACSHGDVIKALIADALGMHLDLFQRISVDPCSVSVVRYTTVRPFVLRVNDTGGDVAGLLPPKRKGRRRRPSSDAAVGGGAGGGRVNSLPSCRARSISSTAPSRFIAGTVGQPGDRTFYLQATESGRTVSVALEKVQVALLADRLEELLGEVQRAPRRGGRRRTLR